MIAEIQLHLLPQMRAHHHQHHWLRRLIGRLTWPLALASVPWCSGGPKLDRAVSYPGDPGSPEMAVQE